MAAIRKSGKSSVDNPDFDAEFEKFMNEVRIAVNIKFACSWMSMCKYYELFTCVVMSSIKPVTGT